MGVHGRLQGSIRQAAENRKRAQDNQAELLQTCATFQRTLEKSAARITDVKMSQSGPLSPHRNRRELAGLAFHLAARLRRDNPSSTKHKKGFFRNVFYNPFLREASQEGRTTAPTWHRSIVAPNSISLVLIS